MKQARESLERAAHKLAEAMYKKAADAPPSGSSGGGPGPEASSGGTSDDDQVIDAEYVDTEGGKR
jgi:molecular chaperone DnaK